MKDDLIYRSDCLKALCEGCCSELKNYCSRDACCGAGERIKNIRAIDAKTVIHAKWELTDRHFLWKCSNCGYFKENRKTNYCPECGAMMDMKSSF